MRFLDGSTFRLHGFVYNMRFFRFRRKTADSANLKVINLLLQLNCELVVGNWKMLSTISYNNFFSIRIPMKVNSYCMRFIIC